MSADTVVDYHTRTQHFPWRYARSLGYMDWATQPKPFRWYEGAARTPLPRPAPTQSPALEAVCAGTVRPAAVNLASIGQFFGDSLAISAWKAFGDNRWALRCNPSSGNLHPTEGYLVCGPGLGFGDQANLLHYACREHAMEHRRTMPLALWSGLLAGLPESTLLIGLSSIVLRESWKYGERAFRYCLLDAGHALGALAYAAAALGWRCALVPRPGDDSLAALFGIADAEGPEAERPDLLLAVGPDLAPGSSDGWLPEPAAIRAVGELPLAGAANRLAAAHQPWPIIEACADACTQPDLAPTRSTSRPASTPSPAAGPEESVSARAMFHQRRSAVAMDGSSTMSGTAFFALLRRTLNSPPVKALPWPPHIHLGLLVHRVDGLAPGLYMLNRDTGSSAPLNEEVRGFTGAPRVQDAAGLDLRLLMSEDLRAEAQAIACTQDIAADGAFSVALLANFDAPIRERGPWWYRRLHHEAGAVGQILYIEAEAAGLRGTGIGCYFDKLTHDLLGLRDESLRVLYQFTIGGPVEDTRLQTLPAYPE